MSQTLVWVEPSEFLKREVLIVLPLERENSILTSVILTQPLLLQKKLSLTKRIFDFSFLPYFKGTNFKTGREISGFIKGVRL